ncbi:pickpocket protein 19-like [Lycorma delicatula]|uniref:pickpocket protein 19-like n=1 Tax=Lycorma delicatula TaxID=130591 RepID=UPI003F513750
MAKKSKCSYCVWTYIKEFGEITTLHGIVHLVSDKLHWTEIFVWAVAVSLSIAASTILIYNSWYRYYTNPTVISLQKDYRTWELPFPAATVCFTDKLNDTLATNFIKKTYISHFCIFCKQVLSIQEKSDYYKDFLSSIANAKYGTLHNFFKYKNDKSFQNLDLADIAHQVSVKMIFHSTIFNPKYKDMGFLETLTEMGLCYTYSGVMSQYLTLQSDKQHNYNFSPPHCNFLNSLCYARIEDLPVNVTYYIHSPFEMPEVRAKNYVVVTMMERDTTFHFLETVASKELRSLTPEQRKCRFIDEPLKHWNIPKYSYNICLMECRRSLAYKLCSCAPHFYKKHENIPVCDLKGLACLIPHTEALITLTYEGKRVKCECYPTCEDINLYIDKDTVREWTYPVPCNIRFRYAIELYSKTRLKRDILFGYEDLLVSFGGTAALFLGCSLLTFVEVFYFFGLRLFWYIYRGNKSV